MTHESHPKLRKKLHHHHLFLYELYSNKSGPANRRRLFKATDQEMKVLLRILLCLERGHIPIRSADYEQLIKSRRLNQLLALRKKFKKLLQSSPSEKRKWLTKLNSLYCYLLHPLFN